MLSNADRIRLFPVLGRMTYLNTAWRGPISTPAADAAKGYIDDLALRGVTGFDDWQKVWYAARDEFAAFVNAQPAEIQLLPNATEAFARIALGIDWRAGDHAVVPARDYPGVARVLNDLARHGVELANVPTRPDGSVPAEDLIAAINPRTRLVAASHVDFRTGYRMDAAKLAAGCRARGALCALDSVQGVGAVPVDVKQWDVDFATFEGRKWLNGLDTLGVLYVRQGSLAALTPHTLGTYSVPSPYDFETPNQPLAPGAQRFQLGAPAMPQVYALRAALKLQLELGPNKIIARVAELNRELRTMASAHGYSVIGNDWDPANQSGIVSIRREGKLADVGLGAKLVAGKVAASARQGILRVSPHYYNESADLKRLFEVLGAG